jgi:hypothetical protein
MKSTSSAENAALMLAFRQAAAMMSEHIDQDE